MEALLTIHGFNVSDNGKSTVALVAPYFLHLGYAYFPFHYGWSDIISPTKGVLWRDRILVNAIQDRIEKLHKVGYQVTVVGHSNGATLGWMATHAKVRSQSPDKLVCINPAIEPSFPLGAFVERAVVCFSPDDKVLNLAGLLSPILPNWLLPWGNMGKVGPKTEDPRIVNIPILDHLPDVRKVGHSGIFQNNNLDRLMPVIIEKLT